MFPSKRIELLTTLVVVALLASAATPVSAASGNSEFADDEFTGDRGTVIEITLNTLDDANDTVNLHIGNEPNGFLVHVTAVDEDGDGSVTVALNTSTAGQTAASSYISAVGDDSISNVTQESDLLADLLDPGTYPMKAGPIDNATDTATLLVETNESATDPIEATPKPKPPEEVRSGYVAPPNEDGLVTIPLVFDTSRTMTVEMSSRETAYNTTFELVDGNRDYKTNVTLDLTATDQPPSEYISVSNGDQIKNITWNESVTEVETEHPYSLNLSSPQSHYAELMVIGEPETETPKPTTSVETTPTENTTTESNESATTTSGESTDTGIPGFGAALAVVALVAAAFVATRR
ncbi:hypothetical protein C453_03294 [Haloferax elongans ATCC BAA-1513]|uniref:PGF-CTERM sorting domain-containing protein n=1 Tax=Haloferax elongans ATCC BAA-1513 TaxID=1230453 RepID=M0HUB6_HALEO|nr:PGF-CTERM sorting domain-containing protein [Haloferax elongans]ELZ87343.1 hypothetical protein C453_03294 [Haloferax elongans ATCC BAA-1513]